MKSCEKCGTKTNVTKHHVLPRCLFGGAGGICYLCRFHHDEVEVRILKTERQMADGFTPEGPSHRFRLSEREYKEILEDYLNETTPIQAPQFANVVPFKRKFVVRDCRMR